MTSPLSTSERREAILAILGARESIRVQDLHDRLGVSDVTIRKDLAVLEDHGYLRRTRGGAVIAERREPGWALPVRRQQNLETKRRIAQAAVALISHGDALFIDAGTTCALFADAIRDMDVKVVTNSLDVMTTLADRSAVTLTMIGGSYRHEAGSLIGPWATANLGKIQLDRAILGATGVSLEGRFSSRNSIESEVKSAAIEASRHAMVLADASKIGVQAFSVFAGPTDIDTMITELDEGDERIERLEHAGIHVITTSKGGMVPND